MTLKHLTLWVHCSFSVALAVCCCGVRMGLFELIGVDALYRVVAVVWGDRVRVQDGVVVLLTSCAAVGVCSMVEQLFTGRLRKDTLSLCWLSLRWRVWMCMLKIR